MAILFETTFQDMTGIDVPGGWDSTPDGYVQMTGSGSATSFGSTEMPVGAGYVEYAVWVAGAEWVAVKVHATGTGAGYDANGQGILVRGDGSIEVPWLVATGGGSVQDATAPDIATRETQARIGFEIIDDTTLDIWLNHVLKGRWTFTSKPGTKLSFGAYNGSYGYMDHLIVAEDVYDVVPHPAPPADDYNTLGSRSPMVMG